MRVGIVGLGLIGGSLALALRARHAVRGYDADRSTREAARAARLDVAERAVELLPADAVVVATPMAAVLPTLADLAPRADGAVLLDVASVRAPVDAFARETGARIVGMHPMAGGSAQGFAAAGAELLRSRPFLVVPTATADAPAMAVAGTLARDAGGVVTVCSGEQHDRIVAAVSAVPLALAAALALAAEEVARGRLADVAGPGLRDATRLALTPEELAVALLSLNAAHVLASLARLRALLDELERAVAEHDDEALRAILRRARETRGRLG